MTNKAFGEKDCTCAIIEVERDICCPHHGTQQKRQGPVRSSLSPVASDKIAVTVQNTKSLASELIIFDEKDNLEGEDLPTRLLNFVHFVSHMSSQLRIKVRPVGVLLPGPGQGFRPS